MHLTGAFVFMFSAIGCSLFGDLIPEHFGNIILTFFTLIKIITLDDWFEIQQHGSVENGFNTPLCLYLTGFIFLMVFVIFNLLIAVLVDTFNVANDENRVKMGHEEARIQEAVARIEAMESDHDSDSDIGLEGIFGDEGQQKKKDKILGHEEDFCHFFEGCLPTDLMLRQWYYRILPGKKDYSEITLYIVCFQLLRDKNFTSTIKCHLTIEWWKKQSVQLMKSLQQDSFLN